MVECTAACDIRHGGSVRADFEQCMKTAGFAECIVQVFGAVADAEATAQRQYGEVIDILELPIRPQYTQGTCPRCGTNIKIRANYELAERLADGKALFQNSFKEIRSDEHDHEQRIRMMMMDLTGKTRL